MLKISKKSDSCLTSLCLIGLVQDSGSDEHLGDRVRVAVRRGSSVLQVALLLLANTARNSDTAATVGHASTKIGNIRGLVVAGQAASVVEPSLRVVDLNVRHVTLRQLLDGLLNGLDTALLTHLLGRVVGVRAGAVPVASDWLRVECDNNAELLGDTVQDVAADPQVIAGIDALQRTHLELPLGRHHLTVDAANLDSGVQAGLVVSIDDVATVRSIGANRAVVRALWGRVAVRLGPAEWPAVTVHQTVLLLDAEPWLGVFGQSHGLIALESLVGI